MYNKTNSPDTWEAFKKSPACSWLPSPPAYGEDNKSYFTKLGYDKFMSDTWPVLTKYIPDDTIDCDEVEIPVSEIVYQDDYQFITGSSLEESNTERKNLIMKEQVTKILEAYNSGVLTQEEATAKIESIQEEYTPKSGAEKSKVEEMKENWDEDYFQKLEKLATDEKSKMNPKVQRDYQALYEELKKYRPKKVAESATVNNLREKQDKIMESFKMGIINATEGMRLIERVLMEADFITEEEDTAYEGDDASTDTADVPDVGGDDSSDDSNIESLADYINSLDASERADLLSKINTDVATAGDADSSDDIENTDDTAADDLTPPDGETEEPTAEGDTDAEPEV